MSKEKKVKVWISVLLAAFLLLATGGCGSEKAEDVAARKQKQEVKKTVIRFSQGLPEKHYISSQMKDWADLARQKSNGALEVQIYPSAQLYKDSDVNEAVMTGAVESAQGYSVYLAKMIPEMKILDSWFFIKNSEGLEKIYNMPIRERLDAELEKKGIKALVWLPWSQEDFGLVSTKQLKTPADAKGLTMRTLGPETSAYYVQYGINPSFLNGSEIYMGLQRGVIQGAFATVATSVERKLYEVAPHITLLPCGTMTSMVIVNKDFFDKLPPELQKAMVDAGKEVESKSVAAAKANYENVIKEAEKLGVKVYRPTPEEMKLWEAPKEKVREEAYKNAPQLLKEIQEIEKIWAK
ncbi:MAG: hypothetical protein VR68_13215 [Peptococcaceae bacterium BRH_c4a]|nr:MAG: hypothetical protein VR68_13215 [Peptococcaceae bacterium BRH_c4a]